MARAPRTEYNREWRAKHAEEIRAYKRERLKMDGREVSEVESGTFLEVTMQEREKCAHCGKPCEFVVKTATGAFCSTKCANASHSSIVTATINEVSNEPIVLGTEVRAD